MPAGINGTDGYTPTYQPDAKWNMWSVDEIYTGTTGQNKYIPKVNDYVIEPATFTTWIVKAINPVTYVPTLQTIKPFGAIFSYNELDVLLGAGNESYRAYLDTTTNPYTLAVDGRLKLYSSNASYARIYRGVFIDPTKIISRRYDNSNTYVGSDIPLELVGYTASDNYAIKVVKSCSTLEEMPDGEVITIVIHGNDGVVLSKRAVIVENTNYIPRAFNEQKYITNVSITSPFISNTQADVINFPINIPVAALPILGVVHYNDGTTISYPVNGGKFNLMGLEQYVSTIIGHKVPLVLSYRLDPSEPHVGGVTSDGHYITKPYTLKTVEPNTSYNVKLFVYPEWLDSINGYKLNFYLMNLDRNIIFNVSSMIYSASNSPTFSPKAYGITQRLTYSLNLQQVSNYFSYFIHVQSFDVVLRADPTTPAGTAWEVSSEVPSTIGMFGANLKATIVPLTNNKVKIDNNLPTATDWLNKVYIKSLPLVNPMTEVEPLAVTHIEVKYNSESMIKTVEEYNSEFVFSNPVAIYKNIEVVFLKQVYNGYLKLSVANLPIR